MITALFDHELTQQVARLTGIRADYIEIFAQSNGWGATMRAAPGWTPQKTGAVKNAARQLQGVYSLRKSAA